MKLIKIETKYCQKQGIPTIFFNSKGLVKINRQAAELLKIDSGMTADFYQDEHEPRDWYIAKGYADGRYTFRKLDKFGNLAFNNQALVSLIANSLKLKPSFNFPIALEPIPEGMHAILTSARK